jgi:hypothetical protein
MGCHTATRSAPVPRLLKDARPAGAPGAREQCYIHHKSWLSPVARLREPGKEDSLLCGNPQTLPTQGPVILSDRRESKDLRLPFSRCRCRVPPVPRLRGQGIEDSLLCGNPQTLPTLRLVILSDRRESKDLRLPFSRYRCRVPPVPRLRRPGKKTPCFARIHKPNQPHALSS